MISLTSYDSEGFRYLTYTTSPNFENGIAKIYYSDGGNVFIEKHKKNKVINKAKLYYKNGNLLGLIDFESGIGEMYYEDGNLSDKFLLTKGKVNGVAKGYNKSGSLRYEITYKDGDWRAFELNRYLCQHLLTDLRTSAYLNAMFLQSQTFYR